MFDVEDSEHEPLKRCKTLGDAKEFCKEQFGEKVMFDGNLDLGAPEIYVYPDDEEADGAVAFIVPVK